MKVKLNQILMHKGKPLPMSEQDKEDTTLKYIIINSLYLAEKDVSGVDKHKRYKLAGKIDAAKDEIDLKSEDVTLIKELISKSYPSPLISGQAWEMIEPDVEEKNK